MEDEVLNKIFSYSEINDYLKFYNLKSNNPNLFIVKLPENETFYRHSFKLDFFSIILCTDGKKLKIKVNDFEYKNIDSLLIALYPNQTYQYSGQAKGYVIYFKREFFNLFKPDFETEFSFFDVVKSNFYSLKKEEFKNIEEYIQSLQKTYKKRDETNKKISVLKLLATLYIIKKITQKNNPKNKPVIKSQQILLKKYLQLINKYFLEKRTVKEYAVLFSSSSQNFSRSIKFASNKNALSFINDRIIKEAKSLLLHTNCSISEIAFQLNFNDTSNFGKFFKKHAGKTPLEYRQKKKDRSTF